jgi:hypothetical protein
MMRTSQKAARDYLTEGIPAAGEKVEMFLVRCGKVNL